MPLHKILIFILLKISLCTPIMISIDLTNTTGNFYKLPRFWTNTGFCPWGNIKNSTEISKSLLSKDTRMNIELIGALPNNALSTIRIHWLLELIDFQKFNKNNIPEYNFQKLDKFLKWINIAKLGIGFEFMGNPGKIFSFKNVTKEFLWENLSFQIVERYLSK